MLTNIQKKILKERLIDIKPYEAIEEIESYIENLIVNPDNYNTINEMLEELTVNYKILTIN